MYYEDEDDELDWDPDRERLLRNAFRPNAMSDGGSPDESLWSSLSSSTTRFERLDLVGGLTTSSSSSPSSTIGGSLRFGAALGPEGDSRVPGICKGWGRTVTARGERNSGDRGGCH